MILYYSYISRNIVTELEAHVELYNITARWYYCAHPKGNFDAYILKHPEKLTIQYNNNYFKKVEDNARDSIGPPVSSWSPMPKITFPIFFSQRFILPLFWNIYKLSDVIR